ncbi:CRISPR-associated protein Cse2 [Verminephrobacter aporrectodeae subsp. tuberculatae]|uniref:type I-E CRISPR-associated protein Cse2/CasB n=1 Tax=Verminephrobacter aporrectodeae TaxID=1110389 RepID=UPI002237C3A4|nr:type I-E CRISPR-associated protein Cse2/CasB [Verminephrobacter aporrectodeae]MCW5221586.1 CRISPR-associated protein Cse2 [Verminephrobacter aporrectodeae subsp. tuberculatae]MCW5290876.1 CRISPR-associated protein Cse2 [Verminephrobacter aporrectodeae subsp. tuberculatae]
MHDETPIDAATANKAEVTGPRSNPYAALAAHMQRAGSGDRAALARLDPDALRPHELAALSRALLSAGLQPETWRAETWPRWALIAHGVALAGHDGAGRLGRQLAKADVSESRVTRLLTARGDAFRQLLPRILRLLASRGVQPNWYELGDLVLKEGSSQPDDAERAEQLRMRIAGPYFSARGRENA